MDRLLGSHPGVNLRESGAASEQISRVISRRESANPVLAGIYWWLVLRSPRLQRALYALGVDAEPTHRILVSHAGDTRFDMMLMVPSFKRAPVRLNLYFDQLDLADAYFGAQFSGRGTVVDRILGTYPEITQRQIRDAAVEVARAASFGIVVTAAPDEEETCVPIPPIGVADRPDTAPRSVVGALFEVSPGWQATTALHAINPEATTVYLDEVPGVVVKRDETTDSCLISLEERPAVERVVGLGGTRGTLLPGIGEPVKFFRRGEGGIETKVIGVDMSALDPQQKLANKVYSAAVTRPGDSGVALIDDSDRPVGFASRRSSARSAITFSMWIWADQVFDALGLR